MFPVSFIACVNVVILLLPFYNDLQQLCMVHNFTRGCFRGSFKLLNSSCVDHVRGESIAVSLVSSRFSYFALQRYEGLVPRTARSLCKQSFFTWISEYNRSLSSNHWPTADRIRQSSLLLLLVQRLPCSSSIGIPNAPSPLSNKRTHHINFNNRTILIHTSRINCKTTLPPSRASPHPAGQLTHLVVDICRESRPKYNQHPVEAAWMVIGKMRAGSEVHLRGRDREVPNGHLVLARRHEEAHVYLRSFEVGPGKDGDDDAGG